MSTTVLTNPAFADGAALEKSTLTKLKAMVDGVASDASAAIPKLVGDEIAFAESYVTSHASGLNATIIGGALAIGGSEITSATTQLDALAQAYIVSFAKTIDLHLTALGAS